MNVSESNQPPRWRDRRWRGNFQAWLFLIALYLFMPAAFFLPHDFRDDSPLAVIVALASFMLRTFVLHAALLLTIVLIAAAWRRSWRLLLAGMPIWLFMAALPISECWPRRPEAARGETISLLSMNLLVSNRHTTQAFHEINAASPDIVLFQEYNQSWHVALFAALGESYPYQLVAPREDAFGMAIYSRRPFEAAAAAPLKLGSLEVPQFRLVVPLAGRNVALYSLHLLPPSSRRNFAAGRLEFANLADLLRQEPLPAIVAGDFNFTESSPQAAELARIGFSDAQLLGGQGRGATWPEQGFLRYLPGLRLDHFYLSAQLTCTECRNLDRGGSDHRPVFARIGFR